MPLQPALTAIAGFLALYLGNPAWAQPAIPDQTTSTETAETTSDERAGDDNAASENASNMVDRSYESVDDLVQSTVRRIDGFFVNDEHSTFTDRRSRVRLRLNSDYIQHAGWDFSPKVKLNLVLPGMNDRLRLVVNDDQGADVDQAATDDNENDVALRWIGRQNAKRGYSFDLGLRIKSGNLDPFGRVNLGFEYDLVSQSINDFLHLSFLSRRLNHLDRPIFGEPGLSNTLHVAHDHRFVK